LTKTGKIKKAPASEVARWISIAWKEVSPMIVQKSFQKCCVTNALDGSEDDLIWENNNDDDDQDSSSSDEDENSGNSDDMANDSSDDDDD
jgi:hypothetical protein